MNLALVISELPAGGAQRVLSVLANQWAARGRRVTLITLAATGADSFRLDPSIRRVGLGLRSPARGALEGVWNNVRRWRALRAALREARPDLVLSFVTETNVLTLLSSLGLALRVIVSERSDPGRYPLGRSWSWLRRRLYPAAVGVVVQTEAARAGMRRAAPGARLEVIPNPALLPEGDPLRGPGPPERGPFVVGLGRLAREKGFDLLLRAFALCAPRHHGWSLVLVGDGPERAALADLAAELGLAARVRFTGLVPDPGRIVRRAALFVMPSRYEGFPNALLEAMACGLAVIAVDCPSGPREIVDHERNGLLVPPEDPKALAAAMDRLMADEAVRRRLGERAVEVLERFNLNAVMGMWEALMARAARGGS